MRTTYRIALLRNETELQLGTKFNSRAMAEAALNRAICSQGESWLLIREPVSVCVTSGKLHVDNVFGRVG